MGTQVANHDATPKINLIPAVTLYVDIPGNCNLCSFHKGDVRVGAKDIATNPTSDVR